MRVLLICPNQPGINNIPEIRALSELHRTYVLSGPVTVAEIYQAVRKQEYDVIHLATHTLSDKDYNKFAINGNEVLTADDLIQIGKLARNTLFFFNACHSAKTSIYIVKRTKAAAIFTTVEIEDVNAWKVPLSFYEMCADAEEHGKVVDYREAFNAIDDESGIYGYLSSKLQYEELVQQLTKTVHELSATVVELQQAIANITQAMPKIQDNVAAQLTEYRDEQNFSKPHRYFLYFVYVTVSIITIGAFISILTFFFK